MATKAALFPPRTETVRLIWAWRLLLLLVAYVPFAYQAKILLGDAALLAYDIILIVCAALVVTTVPNDAFKMQRIALPVVISLVVILVNSLAQVVQTPAFPFAQGIRAILLPTIFAWLLLQVVHSDRQLRIIIAILVVTALVAALNGVRQSIYGLSPAEWAFYVADSDPDYANNLAYKVPSSMGAAHAFAAAMSTAIILMWLAWKKRILRPPVALISVATIVMVAGLFASGNRAALGLTILWSVALLVIGALHMLAQAVAQGRIIVNASVIVVVAATAVAAVASVIYIINSPLYEDVEQIFKAIVSLAELTSSRPISRDGSAEARLKDIMEVWRSAGLGPFGYGLGAAASVDNQLIVALGETGYLGALAYVALVVALFVAGAKQLRVRANRATAWIGLNLQMFFLGMGLTSPILLHPVASFYFAVGVFLTLHDRRKNIVTR